MGLMPKFLVLALLLLAAPLSAQLKSIQTVYLFPMGNGMDQYLANRLTSGGVFQVVTDPLKADGVFTDRLGEAFESRFAEIYIKPEEERKKAEEKKAAAEAKKAAKKAAKKDGDKKADKDKDEVEDEPAPGSGLVDNAPKPLSSFSRGRGNLFLVERKSQAVVWSVYDRPKDSTPKELDRVAARVVEKLNKARGGK